MKKLRDFKKIYWDIKVSKSEVSQSWQKLETRLNNSSKSSFPYFRYSFMYLSLVIALFAGIAGVVNAADPGTPLYQVKIASDKFISKVTGKPEIEVQRRGEDLIEASKKESEGKKMEKASDQYQKTLDETAKEVQQNKGNKEKLINTLDKHQSSFKQAIKENPKAEKNLEKVIEKTQEVKDKLEEKKEEKKQENEEQKQEAPQNNGKKN